MHATWPCSSSDGNLHDTAYQDRWGTSRSYGLRTSASTVKVMLHIDATAAAAHLTRVAVDAVTPGAAAAAAATPATMVAAATAITAVVRRCCRPPPPLQAAVRRRCRLQAAVRRRCDNNLRWPQLPLLP
jgi:hypothetical protein